MERRAAIRRRRHRIVWVVCGGFCVLVLVTSFPLQQLVRQRDSISSTAAEVKRLTAGNAALQQQAEELSDPANIAALARRDYGMVRPGDKAYAVIPVAGSPEANLSSGHSALDQGAVAPGSAESQELLGDQGSGSQSSSADSASAAGANGPPKPARASPPGLWGRVLDSLEFWR